VELRHGPLFVLWPPSSFCTFVASVSSASSLATRDTFRFAPSPSVSPGSALTGLFIVQPKLRRIRPKASLSLRRCSSAPESPLDVSNSPTPLISRVLPYCPRNRSPELSCAAVGLLHRETRPLVPSPRCRAHG
jgi:hypothetical protein